MMKFSHNTPVLLRDTLDDSHTFKRLPIPIGDYPYRLNIQQVLGEGTNRIRDKMSFHMIGDTGSVRHSAFQAIVASALAEQSCVASTTVERPAFLYHLGDIVYNHGEAIEYPGQFLRPYENYQAPIFAIPGNHDGDINPETIIPYQSLEAFMDVFCDSYPRKIGFGRGIKRLSMIQPNVYWTLETPLARFIGLYANVTKHGTITAEQRDWFIEELRYAEARREEQAVFVCVHQAPYSADANHGSSMEMVAFLEEAFLVAGMKPDAVFSGHVHNYQRFSRAYPDGAVVPYIVAGAGGYADLHTVATLNDSRVKSYSAFSGRVRLEAYCDDCFGFLKMSVEKKPAGLSLIGEYYTLPKRIIGLDDIKISLHDRFVVPLKRTMYANVAR